MLSLALCLSLCTPAANASATVSTLAGAKLEGPVAAISAEGVQVTTAAGLKTVPVRELAKVRWGVPVKGVPEVIVEAADGSLFAAREFTSVGDKAAITAADGGKAECGRRLVRSVRFIAANSPDESLWKAALNAGGTGDVLIVRKLTKTEDPAVPAEVFLDPLEGSVVDVTTDAVKFDFDGEKINVKRDKLEGILFFKPSTPAAGTTLCRVIRGRTNLAAAKVEVGSALTVTTRGGITLELPLVGTTLDFAAGNVAYLAELEPDTLESNFSLQPKGMKADFSRILGLRTGGSFGGRGLLLGKQTFSSGITLHSKTTVTYRVPEGFRTLSAVAGLAEEAARGAEVQVRIQADQRVLFDRTFDAENRGPAEVECDLTGVRRITIVVEPAGGLDLGDILILGDARFVK